ncbi:hypothetical protein S2E19_04561 [Bacillus mycoides]|nr:hypothetical protein S2E19_04561 [Bacillus mycoides]
MKKKVKGMIIMTIVASLLGGCSLGETKIDYEPFVKALDEGDMKRVMSASDDGYAHVTQRGIYSMYEQKEDGEHSKTIRQTTEGVYYHGEINKRGKAVGYHHESMMGGKVIPGTESVPDKNGIYRAKVEIDGVEKVAKSSFFPKEWNRVDVLKAIDEAYQNKKQIGPYKYKGITSSGIKIEMYLNTDGSIATAYPLYKK